MALTFEHLVLRPEEVDFVIYHHPCFDGIGSALAFDQVSKLTGNKVEFFPTNYGRAPPDVTGKNVAIVDFSYDTDTTNKMISKANKLIILDHHQTAEAKLKSIPDQNKVFRMDYSGAYLSWKYCFPDQEVPQLIEYIQDYDLWRKQMVNGPAIISYLSTVKIELDNYRPLLDPQVLSEKIAEGAVIEAHNNLYIKMAVDRSYVRFALIKDKYYMIALCNSALLKSEIGNALIKHYPMADFSAVYHHNKYGCNISLRSEDGRTDVTEIASQFGGGGHRNASGMTFNDINFGRTIDLDRSFRCLEQV